MKRDLDSAPTQPRMRVLTSNSDSRVQKGKTLYFPCKVCQETVSLGQHNTTISTELIASTNAASLTSCLTYWFFSQAFKKHFEAFDHPKKSSSAATR